MSEILRVDSIHTYYGESYILQGLSLKVGASSAVALVGRNGMGKTTTMYSIIGFTPPRRGSIIFKETEIIGMPAHRRSKMGISLVPQGRRIFPALTVRENLAISYRRKEEKEAWDLEKVFELFPSLKSRINNRGNQLSGGEQQMLAIGRALVSNPDLMLMDEPSEGLAPLVIEAIGRNIRDLREKGFAILLAEQNLPLALSVANYTYVINKGMVVFEGSPESLQKNEEVSREYLAL
jgi:branched-chain amino acid transport system ATP-binding protein